MLHQALAAGLRQALAPASARGRVLGTLRFAEWGAMPAGSLLGGFVSERWGLGVGLLMAATVVACAALPALATPLASMRSIPTPANDAAPAVP
ncbi:MFS transporter [Actinomyces sp. B33]|uniref:MFS transporter n=1 Tax=Actinomyces sp. B33 TaxID=2942131 RepID=UPI00233FA020|nr:MFS transporter [Actinomyces sp. B33]MDC4232803.1 MFS transporter [Actinomyces sp. B33]